MTKHLFPLHLQLCRCCCCSSVALLLTVLALLQLLLSRVQGLLDVPDIILTGFQLATHLLMLLYIGMLMHNEN